MENLEGRRIYTLRLIFLNLLNFHKMKSILLAAYMLLSCPVWSQNLFKITHSLSDEKWKETTWETFMRTRGNDIKQRFVKRDDQYFLELIMDARKTRIVEKGSYLGFLDRNKKVVLALKCGEGKTSGDNKDIFSYPIDKDQMQLLVDASSLEGKLQIREGYIHDDISERKLTIFKNSIMLITSGTRYDDEKPKIVIKTK